MNKIHPSQHQTNFLTFMAKKSELIVDTYVDLQKNIKKGNEYSQSLIDIAITIEEYIATFLQDTIGYDALKQKLLIEKSVIKAKTDFTKKALIRNRGILLGETALDNPIDTLESLCKQLHINITADKELDFSNIALYILSQSEDKQEDLINKAENIYFSLREKGKISNWISEFAANKLDYEHLEKAEVEDIDGIVSYSSTHLKKRDGFALTDRRGPTRDITKHVDYCLICHEREKDSCSKGLHEKDGSIKKNALGVDIKGCPLDEKISEMHFLRREGYPIAALAMIMLDNPMCAGTGHRICNDCMKGCIFQKQDPVNIPNVETSVLSDILNLKDGLELYGFLMQWNPLKVERPYALDYNGKKVLIVGLGPAGYTLSHYLLNEGFAVVAAEGLKVESALDIYNLNKESNLPSFKDVIEKELDERIISGFGGVSEYGITSRWDKNFLTVLQLLLERRKNFKVLDGIRFGGTITVEDAWKIGFTHIALATGAGKPTLIRLKNNLSRGLRKASDFLMALQLTGAARKDSLSNLQISLPAIVIGGGLTAIDTATETLAYYPIQVEKFYENAKTLLEIDKDYLINTFDEEELSQANIFFEHGKIIHEIRKKAKENNEKPDFLPFVKEWGGVTLVYRKNLQSSPAYRLNHEEINEALEEGIKIIENLNPVECILNDYNAIESVRFIDSTRSDKEIILPAKTVFVAAGTSPNITYEKEYPKTFRMQDSTGYYQPYKAMHTA
jgi:NADPH-dependent glutamate synthase beta subunit-like oxidoreductase